MQLTQQDYNDRKARVDDDTATDEDRRLIKHYENEGFTRKDEAPEAGADDGQNKSSVSEIRENAGDTGTAVVGGVPAGKADGKQDTTTSSGTARGRSASGKQN